jgi:ABC-type sulfate/molybdate transport systems ATPase subunit
LTSRFRHSTEACASRPAPSWSACSAGSAPEGRLAQIGTPAEIYEAPASRFVAEFIGAANLLPAIVRRSEPGGSLLDAAGLGLVQPSRPAPRGVGASIFLAIRPERIALGPATPPNGFHAPIAETAYRGDALSCTLLPAGWERAPRDAPPLRRRPDRPPGGARGGLRVLRAGRLHSADE